LLSYALISLQKGIVNEMYDLGSCLSESLPTHLIEFKGVKETTIRAAITGMISRQK
jgi:hypothetical protein